MSTFLYQASIFPLYARVLAKSELDLVYHAFRAQKGAKYEDIRTKGNLGVAESRVAKQPSPVLASVSMDSHAATNGINICSMQLVLMAFSSL